MDKCLEPRGNGEAKGEPIEQHHEHEEYRYRPHFPYQFSVFVISTAACAARSAACAALLTTAAQQFRLEGLLSSSTRRVAPVIPRESTAVRGAGTGQGGAREQHRQRHGQQNFSHRRLLKL